MVKTINLQNSKKLISNYKTKMKIKNLIQNQYEQYLYNGITETENKSKNGVKQYTDEEFKEHMRKKYGITL